MNNKDKIEILYKEYVRLNERLHLLIDSALDDFKLFGFIWPVITGVATLIGKYDTKVFEFEASLLSFIIFLVLLLIIAIISFRNLLKISLINYQLSTIKTYESEISELFDANHKIFNNMGFWISKFQSNHAKLYGIFTFIVIISVTFIPTIVLCFIDKSEPFWIIYMLISVSMYAIYLFAMYNLLNKPMKNINETSTV